MKTRDPHRSINDKTLRAMRANRPASHATVALALAVSLLLPPLAVAQSAPIGASPQWQSIHQSADLKADYEKTGIASRGAFTYVAVRELEASAPQQFTLSVLALDCKQQRISMATLGTMSLDGKQVQHGKLNDEAKLVKYSVPVAQSQAPYATKLMSQACPR